MAIDNDLAALLPEPPPPRPAQRERAIGEAISRFDGHDPAPRAAPRGSERPRRWLVQHQFASLAAMAVVALLSTTVWLSQGERFASLPPESAAPGGVELPAPAQPQAALPSSAPSRSAVTPTPADGAHDLQTVVASEPAAQPPAPPPAALDQAVVVARAAPAEQSIVVSGNRAERPDFESNSPVAAVEQQLNRLPTFVVSQSNSASARDEDQGVVTGGPGQRSPARAASAARKAAGSDWAACTVTDPARNVAACRGLADPAARGSQGRAAAQLADGLILAWEGDLDRAITAFSRAISTAPDLSIAYLNRGLAYQMKGDLTRATADLDRAVAADPRAARGYYHRSQLRRARGDAAGAEADARRAVELDPS